MLSAKIMEIEETFNSPEPSWGAYSSPHLEGEREQPVRSQEPHPCFPPSISIFGHFGGLNKTWITTDIMNTRTKQLGTNYALAAAYNSNKQLYTRHVINVCNTNCITKHITCYLK